MASTYTGLGTELMTTGENAGTWGTKTNTNLQIIEQMVGGYEEQDIAGGADTTTLSVSDGSTGAVLGHRIIKFTGTITGNQIVTIPLDVQQMYIVVNGTSGAYTVQFKYVSGSGSSVTFSTTDKGTKIVCATADDGTNPNLVDTGITSAFTPTSADGAALGSSSLEFSDLYLADSSIIYFGNDQDVTITHDPDDGLFLKSTATADDNPFVLTLQTGETDMAADDVLGKIDFQAPDEGTGTDAILVAAGIEAVSEGDFSSSNNATKLSFKTAASEAAAEKMKLSSTGVLTLNGSGGSLVIPDAGNIGSASDTDAVAISSAGVVALSATTEASATGTAALTLAGGLGVAKDVWIGDDLVLDSDSTVLKFGDDQDTTLTHTDGTGLTLNSTNKLCFYDTALSIHSSADGQLDLIADTEIQIAATTIDINGAVAMDGAITGATDITLSGELDAATLDISSNADIDGTTNLDAVDIDGAVQIDATFTSGVDGQGYDTKFFGDTASAYMLWDTSADDLVLAGAAGIDLAGDIDVDGTANLDAVDIDGNTQADGTITVGENDTGYDVKFFGATSGAYMLWDESTDDLVLAGASKLYLYDAAGGEYLSSSGSALTIASGSGAWELPAADGSADQYLKTDGSGNLDWASVSSGVSLSGATNNTIATVTGANAIIGETNLTFDATDLLVASTGKLGVRDSAIYFYSSADGQGDLVADSVLQVTAPTVNIEGATAITLESDSITLGENGDTDIALTFNANSADGVLTWMEDEDHFTFSDDVLINSTEKLYFNDAGGEYISGDGSVLSIAGGNEIDLTATAIDINGTCDVSGVSTFGASANVTQQALTSSSEAIAWDASAKPNAYHLTTENTVFSAPSNAVEGAFICVEINYNGSHTIGWNEIFNFAADTAPTTTDTDGKTDILVFKYNGSIWQEVGRTLNIPES